MSRWITVVILGAAFTTLPGGARATNFESEGGFLFDIQDGADPFAWSASGELSDGTSDAYDGCYYLNIDDERYDALDVGGTVVEERTVHLPTITMGRSLAVTRHVHVPASGGDYARYYDTIENTGGSDVTVTVSYTGNLGSDSSTIIWGSSSGDTTVDRNDTWFGTDDMDGTWDPSLGHAFWGEGAVVEPTEITAGVIDPIDPWGDDNISASFVVTIEPGQTVAFMIFAFQNETQALVRAQVEPIVEDFTTTTADLTTDELAVIVNWVSDADGDGFTITDGDCDDREPTVHPGAEELCDGLDNNCDDELDEGFDHSTFYRDQDRDEYGLDEATIEACAAPPGYTDRGGDCNDECASCYPGAPELCDERDNDCDGEVDNDLVYVTFYRDDDRDRFGLTSSETVTCEDMPGWVLVPGDCNDRCATCHPGAEEVCDDLDNDCDGDVDEELEFLTYYRDADADTYGVDRTATDSCRPMTGWVLRPGDCDDDCASCWPGAEEVCDDHDNDCNGEIDEGLTVTVWRDTDGDGYGNPPSMHDDCMVRPGYVEVGEDCNDACAACNPEGEEVCDELDNDCDGEVDEGDLLSTFFLDADGDGFGDPDSPTDACEAPEGYVEDDTDCDDSDEEINPGAEEVPHDRVDNDCDGEIDEGGADGDADGDVDGDVDGDGDIDGDADADGDGDIDADSDGDTDVDEGCGCRAAGQALPRPALISLLFD
jgi:hypothetical protein